jgi:hypothetical protein
MPIDIKPGDTSKIAPCLAQVAEMFPAYRNGEWSPLERGVFNGLLANLIQRKGVTAVTRDVLDGIRRDTLDVVAQYGGWQTDH